MSSAIIEIHPRKPEFDPLGAAVRAELIEAGQPPKDAAVHTQRLYRIDGNFNTRAIEIIAHTLLVDPVVETVVIESPEKRLRSKKSAIKMPTKVGWMVDVWPKPGVTDPVGETVEKGLHDLGYTGPCHAASATRYVFPKLKADRTIESLVKRLLANELIHDLHIRKI